MNVGQVVCLRQQEIRNIVFCICYVVQMYILLCLYRQCTISTLLVESKQICLFMYTINTSHSGDNNNSTRPSLQMKKNQLFTNSLSPRTAVVTGHSKQKTYTNNEH